MGSLYQVLIVGICPYDNTAGIEIVVESLAFPQEFRAEKDIFRSHLLPDLFCVSHRNCRFNDHNGIRVGFFYQLNNSFYRRCIKKFF